MKISRIIGRSGAVSPIVVVTLLVGLALAVGIVLFVVFLPSVSFYTRALTLDDKAFEFIDTDKNDICDKIRLPLKNNANESVEVRSLVISTSTDGTSWHNVNSSNVSVPFLVPEGRKSIKEVTFTPIFSDFISPGEISYRVQVTYNAVDGRSEVITSPILEKSHAGLAGNLVITTAFYNRISIGGHVVDRGARDSAAQSAIANVIKITIANNWIADLQIFNDFGSFSPGWCAGLWADDSADDGVQDYANKIYGLVIRDGDFSMAWACKAGKLLGKNYDTGSAQMWGKVLGQTSPATIAGVDNDVAQTIKQGETAVFHFISLGRNPTWGAFEEGKEAYLGLAFHDHTYWGTYFLHQWFEIVSLN
jgi:hypothetical protein